MDHLAILDKKMKMLSRIVSGKKKIESRWYKFKRTPYQNISVNDSIYFKESGDPVTVKARVNKVLFFDDLDDYKIKEILKEYGSEICVPISYYKKLIGKKFCTLVFIDNIQRLNAFNVDKKGYGLMNAWITINDIKSIRKID